ncbi:MAG: TetR/AcrR family transcriptional regulator [Reyranellaceae bacterium]
MSMTAPAARRRRPRGPGRLSAEDSARLPERLLDAAQAVFIEQGYTRATIDAIARAAGASRKTIYARYAGKDEILAAVFQRLLDSAMPGEPADATPAAEAGDARAALLRQGRALAAAQTAWVTAGLNRLISAESHQFPEVAQLAQQVQGRAVDGVRRTLERLRDEGRLKRLDKIPRAAQIFVEMAMGVQRRNALLGLPTSRRESDALVEAAVDIFLEGCA